MKKVMVIVCLIVFVGCLTGCQESNVKAKPFAERTEFANGEQDSVIGGRLEKEF